MTPLIGALFAIGYPVAIVLAVRFPTVVRLRRVRLFIVHQGALAAVIAGWALLGTLLGVVLNGAWFAAAALWWFWRR